MNIPLLRKIQRRILKEPRQFQMSAWFAGEGSQESCYLNHPIPNCGTAACIAGWAISIVNGAKRKKKIKPVDWIELEAELPAMTALDINSDQASRLFRTHKWPAPWTMPSDKFDALLPEERAKIAVARIDHFIATNGAE